MLNRRPSIGVEHAWQVRWRNAGAVVAHVDHDVVADALGFDVDRVWGALAEYLRGIDEQIDEHLRDAANATKHDQAIGELCVDDGFVPELCGDDAQCTTQGLVDVEGDRPVVTERERSGVTQDVTHAFGPLARVVGRLQEIDGKRITTGARKLRSQLLVRCALCDHRAKRDDVAELVSQVPLTREHVGDRVVDLVRDARRDLADRRQSFCRDRVACHAQILEREYHLRAEYGRFVEIELRNGRVLTTRLIASTPRSRSVVRSG